MKTIRKVLQGIDDDLSSEQVIDNMAGTSDEYWKPSVSQS